MSSPTISSISVLYSSSKKRLRVKYNPCVTWANTCALICLQRHNAYSISLPINPRAFKLLSKWQGKVTLLLWLVIPPSKQACPMQIWWPQRPRNEKLKTFWKIKIYLLKWEPLKCLFQRQGGKKNRIVFYLNVLHILKEVHFWIMAICKLNQVFKFWLIWKGLN